METLRGQHLHHHEEDLRTRVHRVPQHGGCRHQVDYKRKVEMVVTEDADEEIVWDRVERAVAFLDTW